MNLSAMLMDPDFLSERAEEVDRRTPDTTNLSFPFMQEWRAAVRTRVGSLPQTVLDVASGNGEWVRQFHALNHTVTGTCPTDASVQARRRESRMMGLSVNYELALPEALPFPSRSFDVVHSAYRPLGGLDPKGEIQDWTRVLRRSGLLLITEPVSALPVPALRRLSEDVRRVGRRFKSFFSRSKGGSGGRTPGPGESSPNRPPDRYETESLLKRAGLRKVGSRPLDPVEDYLAGGAGLGGWFRKRGVTPYLAWGVKGR